MTRKYKKVVDFYNETTNEQKLFFLELISKDIFVPVKKEDGVHSLGLDQEVPVCMNGTAFQINTEDWRDYEK
jgi:hypothetical protein